MSDTRPTLAQLGSPSTDAEWERFRSFMSRYPQAVGGRTSGDPFIDLCEILNWMDEEAEAAEWGLFVTLHTAPQLADFDGAYTTIREFGAWIIDGADDAPADATLKRIVRLANSSPQEYVLVKSEGFRPPTFRGLTLDVFGGPHMEKVIHAVRALWPILAGKTALRRCPAPSRDFGWDRCGRYFASGGQEGRPRKYCSDRCRNRAYRRNATKLT